MDEIQIIKSWSDNYSFKVEKLNLGMYMINRD